MGDSTASDDDDWVVKDERKLRHSGNSVVVTLPSSVLQEAKMRQGDRVELVADRDTRTITIRLKDGGRD